MIITIDGPAGSGKSTAARKLAARLEVPYLDTGSMYRAVAYRLIRLCVDPSDRAAVIRAAREAKIELNCGPTHTRVILDGHDVTEAIRTMAITQTTAAISPILEVREVLIAKQREVARRLGSVVTEGRDQGSAVFPQADVKFVLEASIDKRTERRHVELIAEGEEVTPEQVRANLEHRDGNDAVQWAPLLEPGRAIVIDTTRMTIGQVVDTLYTHVQRSMGTANQAQST